MTGGRRPVLVASNRGPVTYTLGEDGSLSPNRGAGGLVAALISAIRATGGTWVAAAMTDGDRAQADASGGRFRVEADGDSLDLRYLVIDPERFSGYYNELANRVLWFCHHLLWDLARSPSFGAETERAWDSYRAVNDAFADALLTEAGDGSPAPAFLVQDYHLCLVPAALRSRRPEALIAHFSHIPFAPPAYLRVLPDPMREALLRGMLGADLVGFQAPRWAEHFLAACRDLPGARVDVHRRTVTWEDRVVRVRCYPVSVDAASLRTAAAEPETARRRRALRRALGDRRLILRADRLELSKNVLRGFEAYERFLRSRPDWVGRVTFIAHLYPSRLAIPEYREYADACVAEAERINGALGTSAWTPIELSLEDDLPAVLAAYGLYDVLLVNPVFDGMNLVAKEGPLLNRANGLLVLSRNAGAFHELGRHAIGINPFDVEETANALASALEMPTEERARRARAIRRMVGRSDPGAWARRQLEDLDAVG